MLSLARTPSTTSIFEVQRHCLVEAETSTRTSKYFKRNDMSLSWWTRAHGQRRVVLSVCLYGTRTQQGHRRAVTMAASSDGYGSSEEPKKRRRRTATTPSDTEGEDAPSSTDEPSTSTSPRKRSTTKTPRRRKSTEVESGSESERQSSSSSRTSHMARADATKSARESQEKVVGKDVEKEEEQEEDKEEEDPIWPPLVVCFGESVLDFVPTVRVSEKAKMHPDIYSTWKGHQMSPPEFVRAPGGAPSNVAVALCRLGGRAAFIGKVGDDLMGHNHVRVLNENGVQTRAVRFDRSGARTNRSRMDIEVVKEEEQGQHHYCLHVQCVEESAGASMQAEELCPDVLKEAHVLHFGSTSLLPPSTSTSPAAMMPRTLMAAIAQAKASGSLIFFDPNLAAPLWHCSPALTWATIRPAWLASNIVEVTKQELEFLLGEDKYADIKARKQSAYYSRMEDLDRSRDEYHYAPAELEPLWHEDLRLLLVTDGTLRIHFYTRDFHGSVKGGEDVLLNPLTADRTGSGDAIVAGVLRKLTTNPQLWTNRDMLEKSLRFAICAGVISQWTIGAVRGFPTESATMNLMKNLFPSWMIESR